MQSSWPMCRRRSWKGWPSWVHTVPSTCLFQMTRICIIVVLISFLLTNQTHPMRVNSSSNFWSSWSLGPPSFLKKARTSPYSTKHIKISKQRAFHLQISQRRRLCNSAKLRLLVRERPNQSVVQSDWLLVVEDDQTRTKEKNTNNWVEIRTSDSEPLQHKPTLIWTSLWCLRNHRTKRKSKATLQPIWKRKCSSSEMKARKVKSTSSFWSNKDLSSKVWSSIKKSSGLSKLPLRKQSPVLRL